MCGRFTLHIDLHEILGLLPGLVAGVWPGPRYNIAPTQMIATIPNLLTENGAHALTFMRWGLIPAWAKDHKIAARLINARAETLHEKPAFRAPFTRRRCLVPADGFYEWAAMPGQKPKQPIYIRMKSGKPFVFAGLWERWDDPAGTGDTLTTCTLITTTPNETIAPYHDRMPVILPPSAYDAWLAPGAQPLDRLRALLRPYAAAEMEAYPVSRRVNRPDADDPACITPLDTQLPLL